MSVNLDTIAEPTEADLLLSEDEDTSTLTAEDWESLLDPVIVPESAEDWWADDANVHDDRWDDGIPSWSAWA